MLKKIFIGIGLLFATLVAAGAVFWFGWLTPPESAEVCENVDRVIEDDAGTLLEGKKVPKKFMAAALTEVKKSTRQHCDRFSKNKPMMMAQAVWVKRLKCMRDASNVDGLKVCDDIKSF